MSKRVDQEKKPEGPKGDLPEAHKEVNYRLTSSVELQELKKAMAESPPPPRPGHAQSQDIQNVHPAGRLT
jgi:hypothetical protein